jgi:5-methylcytosine-specific restriction endonuclease McrA
MVSKRSKRLLHKIDILRSFVTSVVRPVILSRDNYQCQVCLRGNLHLFVHHIIPIKYDESFKYAVNPRNLVSLCEQCHLAAHYGNYKLVNKKLAIQLLQLVARKELVSPTMTPIFIESI